MVAWFEISFQTGPVGGQFRTSFVPAEAAAEKLPPAEEGGHWKLKVPPRAEAHLEAKADARCLYVLDGIRRFCLVFHQYRPICTGSVADRYIRSD